MTRHDDQERVVWQAFPSWAHFSWLYFFAALAALRGILFYRVGLPGWEAWIAGAAILCGLVAVVRHWARYLLTPIKLVIRNGYTNHDIASLWLEQITAIECRQGPIARWFGIGTIIVRAGSERDLRLRGVKDPEVVEAKIRALLPKYVPRDVSSDL